MVQEDGLQGLLLGYLSSAVLSAGPWLISIATLAVVSRGLGGDRERFSALVVTINVLTLWAAGPFQFALTRYLADRLYAADIERHLSAFLTCWLVGVAPPTALFGLLLAASPLSWNWQIQALSLFGLTSSMWMLMLFLGVVRAYRVIIAAFVLGNGVSAVASLTLGRGFRDAQLGMLTGYTLGQAVLVALLLWVLVSEFPARRVGWDAQALRSLLRYPALTLAGLLYYGGLWADKAVLRCSQESYSLDGTFWLRANPGYEQAAFLAQLTVLPALALFFLAVETEFFERFRNFFVDISGGRSLFQIGQSKQRMLNSLRSGGIRLSLHQGVVTLVAVLLAPYWLPVELIPLGRTQMVGVYFQTMLYFGSVVLLYYELYGQALVGIALFAVLNTLLAGPTGVGFVVAGVIAVAVNLGLLGRSLPVIERLVFESQPLRLHPMEGCAEGVGVYRLGAPS
jgi:uncharacterized membrane protein